LLIVRDPPAGEYPDELIDLTSETDLEDATEGSEDDESTVAGSDNDSETSIDSNSSLVA
jgi:hypothetical protein